MESLVFHIQKNLGIKDPHITEILTQIITNINNNNDLMVNLAEVLTMLDPKTIAGQFSFKFNGEIRDLIINHNYMKLKVKFTSNFSEFVELYQNLKLTEIEFRTIEDVIIRERNCYVKILHDIIFHQQHFIDINQSYKKIYPLTADRNDYFFPELHNNYPSNYIFVLDSNIIYYFSVIDLAKNFARNEFLNHYSGSEFGSDAILAIKSKLAKEIKLCSHS